mgnify:CR=1 FL=1
MEAKTTFALRSRRVILDEREQEATIIIDQGRIAKVIGFNEKLNCNTTDLGEKVIMPGVVDTHVHINEPGRTEWEGFDTATQAAAAGGITTVVDMPLNCTPVTTSVDALHQKLNSLKNQLWVDCGFWGGVVPDSLDDLEALCLAGVLGAKSFTIHSGIDDFPQVGPEEIRAAIPILSKYGLPYLIHAELDKLSTPAAKIDRTYQSFLESRPREWENDAVDLIITLAKEAKNNGHKPRMHIVHLSSADALEAIKTAQKEGIMVTAETCPHYLTLWAEACPDGETLFKCCPPIREDSNRSKLWDGIRQNVVDFIVSDHSPCTPELKHIHTGDLDAAWGGISSLQFSLPLIWTEARTRGLGIVDVSSLMSSRPAKFAGLGAKKGRIAEGYDADLIIFDDEASFDIKPNIIKHRHKITPYTGKKVHGVVEATILRGHKIYNNGDICGEPIGQSLLKDWGHNK